MTKKLTKVQRSVLESLLGGQRTFHPSYSPIACLFERGLVQKIPNLWDNQWELTLAGRELLGVQPPKTYEVLGKVCTERDLKGFTVYKAEFGPFVAEFYLDSLQWAWEVHVTPCALAVCQGYASNAEEAISLIEGSLQGFRDAIPGHSGVTN